MSYSEQEAEGYKLNDELTKLRKRVECLERGLELAKDISVTSQGFLVYGIATQALAESAKIAEEK